MGDCGTRISDLRTAYLVGVASSDIAGCGFQGVPKPGIGPLVGRDWIPRCLVEESKGVSKLVLPCPVGGAGT